MSQSWAVAWYRFRATWHSRSGSYLSVVAVLAVGVAVALSPLAPLGRVRQVDPSPGIAFDWAVLGSGFLVIVVGLGL